MRDIYITNFSGRREWLRKFDFSQKMKMLARTKKPTFTENENREKQIAIYCPTDRQNYHPFWGDI